ncbi:MAG TPA: CDF family Co(II)/Ni(II) efflux transporter DmeF [Methylovirgula sp.]|nr:CDF family Co(II)/Ni(II) efflux transporter DmeF [Methylovirgula sp.]
MTHDHSADGFVHPHVFLGADHEGNERRSLLVVALTAAMMVAEIIGGAIFGSVALIADGLHMSTHAAALGVTALAYVLARRHVNDPRFAFGTGKFGDLAAFASGLALAMVALLIAYESISRLIHPHAIAYNEALAIAGLGLCVNLASAWLLGAGPHEHHHHHHHGHDHHEHDHHEHDHHDHSGHAHAQSDADHNMRAAYVHVLADAATSLLVIAGLLMARIFGFVWMDPVVGLIGVCVILSWAFGLLRDSGSVLLDVTPDDQLCATIKRRLETEGDFVSDLHLWRLGPGHKAAVISIVSDHPKPPEEHKARIADLPGLSHVTIEVHPCPGAR